MFGWFNQFLDTQGFMPHGMCLLWKPSLIGTHVVADVMIALAYFAIPMALLRLLQLRNDIKYPGLIVLFGSFIVFCGITHLVNVVTFWNPVYGIQGIIKFITAVISVITAVVIWALLPRLAKIPSAVQMEEKNSELTALNQKLESAADLTRKVLESAGSGIFGLDAQGRVVFTNKLACKLIGFSLDEIIDRPVWPMLYPESQNAVPDVLLPTENEQLRQNEYFLRRKDGTHFWAAINARAVGADDVISYVLVFDDITLRKNNECALREYAHKLEQTNKDLDAFSYVVCHDLREPLRGLHNYAAFVQEDNVEHLAPDSKVHLTKIMELTQRMEQLIEDLLMFSRIGNAELRLEKCTLSALIADQLNLLELLLKDNNVKVITSDPLPEIVCDKRIFGEIFHNLFTNAIKYNNNDEKIIKVSAEQIDDTIQIAVKDNGIGIPEKYYQKIFQIFKRLHHQKAYGKGTGVGLKIVQKIVESHNGHVWVRSVEGEGATFYIQIPQHPPPLTQEDAVDTDEHSPVLQAKLF